MMWGVCVCGGVLIGRTANLRHGKDLWIHFTADIPDLLGRVEIGRQAILT